MKVSIIGAGYVGLPLAVAFAAAGETAIVIDLDEERVAALNRSESYIEDISSEELAQVSDRLTASSSYEAVKGSDAVLICVPTPLTANREPNLEPLRATAKTLAQVLAPGQLVVLESTTYPGTTRGLLAELLSAGSGLKAGSDFQLAFSPERVDPGRSDYTITNTPKVVSGLSAQCTKRAQALYELICEQVVAVSSPEVAELSKLLENVYRSVNIALVNELTIIADRMGIDIWEVIDAAATKPFGFTRFEPGPGMGGHCLPVDPFYLSWKAREYDLSAEFIELSGRVNQKMPYFCVERIERELNKLGKPVQGSVIALLGVAYKGGVSDTRESPALKIIELLKDRGASVVYHDEFVSELPEYDLASTTLAEALASAALAVIVTAHPGIDYAGVAKAVPALLDLRGVTRAIKDSGVARL